MLSHLFDALLALCEVLEFMPGFGPKRRPVTRGHATRGQLLVRVVAGTLAAGLLGALTVALLPAARSTGGNFVAVLVAWAWTFGAGVATLGVAWWVVRTAAALFSGGSAREFAVEDDWADAQVDAHIAGAKARAQQARLARLRKASAEPSPLDRTPLAPLPPARTTHHEPPS